MAEHAVTAARPESFALRRGPAPAVALVPAPRADSGRERAEIEAWCDELGLTTEVLPVGADGAARGPWQLVVALGGDGTILRALRIAARVHVPVLGVNLGRVGFLADVQPDGLPAALRAVADGEAVVERRGALRVLVEGGPALIDDAFNDVVLGRRAGHGAARIEVEAGGARIVTIIGDGVIVASALGSTAYTVSAGGPAVSPRLDAIVLTSVAANTGPLRSLVLSADEELRLRADLDSAPLTIELDGRGTTEVPPGACVTIGRAPMPAMLLRTTPDTFFEHLRDRLLMR
jgi:NAD+ kinase